MLERRIAALLAAGFAAVLEIEEHVVWNLPHLIVPAVDLARRAAASASVRWIEREGVRFHRTEGVEERHRRVGTAGRGRMSA